MAKRGSERNPTPDLECPFIVGMLTPYLEEASGRLATELLAFQEAYAEWHKAYRKHVANDGAKKDAPVFDPKHFINVRGCMTPSAYAKLVADWNEGMDVVLGPTYNPIVVDVVHAMNAPTARRGSAKKHNRRPSKWDDSKFGEWKAGMYIDETLPRRCHAASWADFLDAEDPSSHVVEVGSSRYICGDGTFVRSAPMEVFGTMRGNYRAGDSARKSLSLATRRDDVTDVVFRIEDRPNEGGGVAVKGFVGDVGAVTFLPGSALTPGYLYRGDTRLTAKEIRKVGDESKGITFKSLMSQPIVCGLISRADVWAEVQSIEGSAGLKKLREREGRGEEDDAKTPQDKTFYNLSVTTRVDPNEQTPFGFRAAQCGMVPYRVADAEGNVSHGVVIGARTNALYNVGTNQAKATLRAATPKVAKAPKTPKVAKAPKAVKAKVSTPKVSTPKVKKAATPKVKKVIDAAAPVVDAGTVDAGTVDAGTEVVTS